jgi:DNA-binding response OmpR family regulator
MTDSENATGNISTILVVDDDADWRALLRESLEHAGFEVFEESRGDRALRVIERQHPDVIVLDHHMPGINGLELTAFVHQRWPSLPVVLTSAFGDRSTVERALGLGARYLDKPFQMSELVREVARLSRSGAGR